MGIPAVFHFDLYVGEPDVQVAGTRDYDRGRLWGRIVRRHTIGFWELRPGLPPEWREHDERVL